MNKIVELVKAYNNVHVSEWDVSDKVAAYNALQAEVSRVEAELFEAYAARDRWANRAESAEAELAALKAKKLEREKPEPVAIVRKCRNDEGPILNSNNDEISVNLPPGTLLYLAPGAGSVPMTLAQAHLLWCEARANNNSPTDAAIELIQLVESHHKIGVKP